MALSDIRMRVRQVGLEQSMEEGYNRGARRVQRRPLKIGMDTRSFEQPLGRITGQLGEFQKSMDASVARVLAFGAAVGVINSVQQAFSTLVRESIAVEKALQDINVLLQLSSQHLRDFGNNLFDVARNTAQGFDAISTAATEFARQGLTAEETLKRVNDAMILTRLSGLDAASSVSSLTAAVNSFTTEALNTTDVVNRLANVDAAFAVSSKDLADSMSRAGAAAMSAGVQFNELLAITTAVQQRTARGGAVIGNAFKTIFTRLQRSNIRESLEEIGVATTNMDGSFRSSASVLRDYAGIYGSLSDAQKAYTSEQVAGVRQVNILKSLIGDMGNEYSIFNRALGTANGTTDQAIKRNDQLNKTMAALASQTALSVQQLAAAMGELTTSEGVERVLSIIKSLSDGLNNLLDPEKGSSLMQGFFRGIGAFIAGPGLVLVGGAFLKIFKVVTKLGLDAGKSLFGLNKEADRQKSLQLAIVSVLQKEEGLYERLLALQGNAAQQERAILDVIKQQTAERAKQQKFISTLAKLPAFKNVTATDKGFQGATPAAARRLGGRAEGHIPDEHAAGGYIAQDSYSAIAEKSKASEAGYTAGAVMKMQMPTTKQNIVYNSAESVKFFPGFKDPFISPPKGKGQAWIKHQKEAKRKTGIDPYAAEGLVPDTKAIEAIAADGFVPNFASGLGDARRTMDIIKDWMPIFEANLKGALNKEGHPLPLSRVQSYVRENPEGLKNLGINVPQVTQLNNRDWTQLADISDGKIYQATKKLGESFTGLAYEKVLGDYEEKEGKFKIKKWAKEPLYPRGLGVERYGNQSSMPTGQPLEGKSPLIQTPEAKKALEEYIKTGDMKSIQKVWEKQSKGRLIEDELVSMPSRADRSGERGPATKNPYLRKAGIGAPEVVADNLSPDERKELRGALSRFTEVYRETGDLVGTAGRRSPETEKSEQKIRSLRKEEGINPADFFGKRYAIPVGVNEPSVLATLKAGGSPPQWSTYFGRLGTRAKRKLERDFSKSQIYTEYTKEAQTERSQRTVLDPKAQVVLHQAPQIRTGTVTAEDFDTEILKATQKLNSPNGKVRQNGGVMISQLAARLFPMTMGRLDDEAKSSFLTKAKNITAQKEDKIIEQRQTSIQKHIADPKNQKVWERNVEQIGRFGTAIADAKGYEEKGLPKSIKTREVEIT